MSATLFFKSFRFLSVGAFVLLVSLANLGSAKTSQKILEGTYPGNVKEAIRALIEDQKLTADTAFAIDTLEKLKTVAVEESIANVKEQILQLRSSSELSAAEIQSMFKNPNDNVSTEAKDPTDFGPAADQSAEATQGRRARPAQTPVGALYVDVYQESPVLIDYAGDGRNVSKLMSFEVVTKYTAAGPHFVRAHLVSTGSQGHRSVVGEFNIDRRHRYYVSHTYGSRMDYAQFFIGGIALHQTPVENYRILGGPASHGCIRHHEWDADALWNLIGNEGTNRNINIKVHAFGERVTLADGSAADGTNQDDLQEGRFGQKLNQWINRSIYCTRHDRDVSTPDTNNCTKSWDRW